MMALLLHDLCIANKQLEAGGENLVMDKQNLLGFRNKYSLQRSQEKISSN
jgi:hypothetical protein